jgi:hypothetical protein
VTPAFVRAVLLLLVIVAAMAIGAYTATHAALGGASNYRVIYLMLTRSIAWFAVLYLAAGLFVTFTQKKPEPLPET